MKKVVVSLLIVGVMSLTVSCYAAGSKTTRFSQSSAREILEAFPLKDSTHIAVLADELSLVQKMYELGGMKELVVAITDRESCDDFEHMVNEDVQEGHPYTRVVCGGLDALDMSSAHVIIVTALDVDTNKLVQRITKLPDGVRLFTRDQLEFDSALHLEAIRAISISPSQAITMYEYVVKRPTVAQLLAELYTGMTGFGISQEEADLVRQAGGDPTYGEIEFTSAEKIFTELVPLRENDVFYDLGCGIGKLALWVYLATPAKKSVGIELSDSRFNLAIKAKTAMEETILPQRKAIMLADWGDKATRKTLDVIRGNIADFKFDDATVIYMCATCYPDTLMQAMVDKFVLLREGLRIVTLKELPPHPSIHLVGTPQRFPMTWSSERGSPVYVYEMRHPQLKDVLDNVYEKEAEAGAAEELTYDAVKKLCNKILRIDHTDIFYSVANDVGKVAMQVYLETTASRVVGIIADQDRFTVAEKAYEKMQNLLSQKPYDTLFAKQSNNVETRTFKFRHESMVDSSLSDATKVFIGAECCESDSVKELIALCKKFKPGTRIVSLVNLDSCSELQYVKTHQLMANWSRHVDAYEYVVGSSSQVKAPKPVVQKKAN